MINIETYKFKRRVCILAAVVDLILFLVKIYIAITTNSISIYVDSLNSLADTFICIFAFIGFIVSAIQPNEKFPFGYGKTEELINLLLSTVILVTGFMFVYSSLQRLMYPVPIWYSIKHAVTIGITALVKLLMGFVFKKIEKKHNSNIIKNLSVDSFLDFFMSLCILISFTLTVKVGYAIDSITGLVASFVIIISGIKSFVASFKVLIGMKDESACKSVVEVILAQDKITDVKSIQCHSYGEKKIITVKITAELNSADEILELTKQLENKINKEFGYELYVTIGGNYERES